jgi:hypothetical protein
VSPSSASPLFSSSLLTPFQQIRRHRSVGPAALLVMGLRRSLA